MRYRSRRPRQEPKPEPISSLDRLSINLVGHPCLFANIGTALMIVVPSCLGIVGFIYLVFTIASFLW